MSNELIERGSFNVKVTEDQEEIFEKIILPSYLEVFKETGKVPGISKIIERVKYNVSARALDCIYEHDESYFTFELVSKYLSLFHCVYEFGGRIFEDPLICQFMELFEDETRFIIGNKFFK